MYVSAVTESASSVITATTSSTTYSPPVAATHSSAPRSDISPNAPSPNETGIQNSNITIVIAATVTGVLIVGLLITIVVRSCRKTRDPVVPPPHEERVIIRDWEFSRSKLRFLEKLGKFH